MSPSAESITSTAKEKPITSTAKETICTPPPIPYNELVSPQKTVDKYPNLLKKSKLTTLAIKLAKESYFGKSVMCSCTVRGVGELPGLPKSQLESLKNFLQKLSLPRHVATRIEFEQVWKGCIESIGQACKTMRLNIKAGKKVV